MKHMFTFTIFLWGLLLIPASTHSQEEEIEEESAAVSLEDYTDEFQENFFEALKQRGIENYDKAINLLLECKRLDPENAVVDHELAGVYLASKQYHLAREFGLEALLSEPANYWYLNTLVEITQKQGIAVKSLQNTIPYTNDKLKENLALIYFKRKNYEAALTILKDIRKSDFSDQLSLKISDSLEQTDKHVREVENPPPKVDVLNPLDNYRSQISDLIEKKEYDTLLKLTEEALENFPSQPYFYYGKGFALNKSSRAQEAVEVLELALDYLLDDGELADKIYRELAEAHTSLGNTSKANMYLSKIKSGS